MSKWSKEVKEARRLRDLKDPIFHVIDKNVTEAQFFASDCGRKAPVKKGYPGLVATKRIYEAVVLALNLQIEKCATEVEQPQIMDAMMGWVATPPGCRDAAERVRKLKKVF